MIRECRGYFYYSTLLCLLLAAVISLAGCTNPEKAKAEHVSKGEQYLKDSRFQEASLEFRNAIQIDDNLGAAHWGLAQAYEGLQRFPEMIDELKRTVQLDQTNLDARNKLGNYYMAASRGKPEIIAEAERLAKEVLQKDPNNIEGHILQASIFFIQKNNDKAFAELNHAIELDPKRVESYLSLARFYIVTNDMQKADELFRRAITVNESSPLAHTEYGKFLVQMGKTTEAEAELRKAVDVGPTDRQARFVLASYYLVNNQLDKAEESYKVVADLDKNKPEGPIVLADFYASTNRLDQATKIYQDILAKSPDYVAGRYRLGELLMMKGDVQGAQAQVDEALKKDQKDRQALLLRARIRGRNGQAEGLKGAIEDLTEVLRQEPNSRSGLYFMAQANFTLGLLDQARNFSAELEKNYPDYMPAKLLHAQIALASGDSKTAVSLTSELLDKLTKTAPDRDNSPQLIAELREKAYLARGTAQLQMKNATGARQDFESARNMAPNDPGVYNNLAALALNENKPDEAMGLFEQTLKLDGTNFNALNGVIAIYARSNELDKAHARIDQASNAFPNQASLHYLKAQIYGIQHDSQGAETELRKSLEIDQNYIPAYSALGALFVNTKQEDRAIAEYKKIIQLRPDNSASAYTVIGMLEDSRKNYDVAVENYKKALEKDPNSIIAANNLAWVYAAYGKGNLDEALRLAQGVVQKNPNLPGFIDTLGWVYYKKGLYGAAVEQLQKAVSLDEAAAKANNGAPSASYHYHLGMALKSKGDKEGSKKELEAAVRLADKSPFSEIDDARKALATL